MLLTAFPAIQTVTGVPDHIDNGRHTSIDLDRIVGPTNTTRSTPSPKSQPPAEKKIEKCIFADEGWLARLDLSID